MTPAERAAALCVARGGNFREEVEAHMLGGVVVATPDLFVLGRAVPRSADVADLWRRWPREECDAWFVWSGVGRATDLLACMPYALPWVGWTRQGRGWREVHWWRTEELIRRFTVEVSIDTARRVG